MIPQFFLIVYHYLVLHLRSAEEYLTAALRLLHNKNPEYELVSFEILSSLEKTNSLLGIENADEVVDRIFSSFCVGK